MKIKQKIVHIFELWITSKRGSEILQTCKCAKGKERGRNKRFCASDRNRRSPVVILHCLEKSFLLLPLSFHTIRLL